MKKLILVFILFNISLLSARTYEGSWLYKNNAKNEEIEVYWNKNEFIIKENNEERVYTISKLEIDRVYFRGTYFRIKNKKTIQISGIPLSYSYQIVTKYKLKIDNKIFIRVR